MDLRIYSFSFQWISCLIFLIGVNCSCWSSSLPPNFTDKTKYWESATKVYSGTVIDVVSEVEYIDPVGINFGQFVRIEVYAAWKGQVENYEELFYYTDFRFWFQPLLKKNSTILVFTSTRYTELSGSESTSDIIQGSVQEFEFGSRCIDTLSNITVPYIFQTTHKLNPITELQLSLNWFYNQFLGSMFYVGNGWYLVEKLGWIYSITSNSSEGWAYSYKLGWIHIDAIHEGWVWSVSHLRWYYIHNNNWPSFAMWVWDNNDTKWFELDIILDWNGIGFRGW